VEQPDERSDGALAFFGVVLWGETRERAPERGGVPEYCAVVIAPLAGSTRRHLRAQTTEAVVRHPQDWEGRRWQL